MQAKDVAKQAAARHAVSFVRDNMIVGLGTGSTAFYAIVRLGELVAEGMRVQAVATSIETEKHAREHDIPLLAEFSRVDMTIDGADEVDGSGNLIKGGGGALTREKIVAAASDREIIVIDASKQVGQLGAFPLPVEVLPFGYRFVSGVLESMGCQVTLRRQGEQPVLTDNQNYILDCCFGKIEDAETLVLEINAIPGVVENGLFVGLSDLVLVGDAQGRVEEISVD